MTSLVFHCNLVSQYMNNNTIDTIDTKETLPEEIAISLSPEILQASRQINGILTETRKISPVFFTHYTNPELDLAGLRDLIANILQENQAIFPLGIENTEMRPVAIAASMLRIDIEQEVERRFTKGSTRYPVQSIKNVLSAYGKGIFQKIQLSNMEDYPRPANSKKPRAKWYLIDK